MEPYESGRFADVTPTQVAAVRSSNDFAALVQRMREDLLGTGQTEWENPTLERFLEALAAVAGDRGSDRRLTWSDLADLLVTASGYE